jgi:ERCC4-related helicase
MKYPKTVVIAITTHGVIPLYKEETGDEYVPHVFYLPTGRKLSVTKISSVVPGICNITNSDDVGEYMNYLIKTLKSFDISSATNNEKNEFLDAAQQYFQELEKQQLRDIQTELPMKEKLLLGKEQKTVTDDNDDGELEELIEIIKLTKDIESDKQFLYYKQNYRRDRYVNKPNREGILYKVYERKSGEQLRSTYDYKINILNVIGIPDLFSEINSRRSSRISQATLKLSIEEIIDYLYFKKKVNEIIIFDFSCSSFADAVTEEPVIDERFIRKARKNFLKDRLHGGKIKRITHHKKKIYARNTRKK